MPFATTDNLRRLVEAGYHFFVEKDSGSRRPFTVYAGVIGTFAVGATAGAFTTGVWGLHAIWVPAGVLAGTLILFLIDERQGTGVERIVAERRAQVRVVCCGPCVER